MRKEELIRRLKEIKELGFVKSSNSLITLFTFNKGVWRINQRNLIEKYGYIDSKGRKALKRTLTYRTDVKLSMDLDESNGTLIIRSEEETLAVFDLYYIVGKFLTKLGKVLYVKADFKRFYILYEASPRSFIRAIKNGFVAVDLRMHLTEKGYVRNRGTAFRVKDKKVEAIDV